MTTQTKTNEHKFPVMLFIMICEITQEIFLYTDLPK